MLQIINGMFAFALFDKTENKLFLCRDKVGKKPLYYNISDNRIVFASEIKALENVLELVLDEEVFNDALYNRYSYNLSPYKGIELLNNGTYLEIDLKKFSINTKEYFQFENLVDENEYNRLNNMSVEMVAKELDQILEESIRIRMISDVPVGTINSGGLDSSLISEMVLEKNDIKMFHIDVEGDSELEYAQLLSDKLDKKLIIRTLKEEDFTRDLVNVIKHYEYPLVHPNAVGIYMLSRLAKQNNVKVLLSGDGADEIFGGYGFFLNEFRSLKIPKSIKTIVGKLNNIVNGVTPPIYSKVFIQSNLRRKRIEQKYSFIENENDRRMQVSLMNSLYEYLQVLNLRADKMGMSHSVEFRCPFLDINVIKFGVNLPLRFKIDGKNGKVILKKVADKRLPKKLIYRKKMGFPVPLVKNALVDNQWNTNQNYVLFSKSVLSDLRIKTEM
jgi:asparagine synthase (glutamine-hydrolysing)